MKHLLCVLLLALGISLEAAEICEPGEYCNDPISNCKSGIGCDPEKVIENFVRAFVPDNTMEYSSCLKLELGNCHILKAIFSSYGKECNDCSYQDLLDVAEEMVVGSSTPEHIRSIIRNIFRNDGTELQSARGKINFGTIYNIINAKTINKHENTQHSDSAKHKINFGHIYNIINGLGASNNKPINFEELFDAVMNGDLPVQNPKIPDKTQDVSINYGSIVNILNTPTWNNVAQEIPKYLLGLFNTLNSPAWNGAAQEIPKYLLGLYQSGAMQEISRHCQHIVEMFFNGNFPDIFEILHKFTKPGFAGNFPDHFELTRGLSRPEMTSKVPDILDVILGIIQGHHSKFLAEIPTNYPNIFDSKLPNIPTSFDTDHFSNVLNTGNVRVYYEEHFEAIGNAVCMNPGYKNCPIFGKYYETHCVTNTFPTNPEVDFSNLGTPPKIFHPTPLFEYGNLDPSKIVDCNNPAFRNSPIFGEYYETHCTGPEAIKTIHDMVYDNANLDPEKIVDCSNPAFKHCPIFGKYYESRCSNIIPDSFCAQISYDPNPITRTLKEYLCKPINLQEILENFAINDHNAFIEYINRILAGSSLHHSPTIRSLYQNSPTWYDAAQEIPNYFLGLYQSGATQEISRHCQHIIEMFIEGNFPDIYEILHKFTKPGFAGNFPDSFDPSHGLSRPEMRSSVSDIFDVILRTIQGVTIPELHPKFWEEIPTHYPNKFGAIQDVTMPKFFSNVLNIGNVKVFFEEHFEAIGNAVCMNPGYKTCPIFGNYYETHCSLPMLPPRTNEVDYLNLDPSKLVDCNNPAFKSSPIFGKYYETHCTGPEAIKTIHDMVYDNANLDPEEIVDCSNPAFKNCPIFGKYYESRCSNIIPDSFCSQKSYDPNPITRTLKAHLCKSINLQEILEHFQINDDNAFLEYFNRILAGNSLHHSGLNFVGCTGYHCRCLSSPSIRSLYQILGIECNPGAVTPHIPKPPCYDDFKNFACSFKNIPFLHQFCQETKKLIDFPGFFSAVGLECNSEISIALSEQLMSSYHCAKTPVGCNEMSANLIPAFLVGLLKTARENYNLGLYDFKGCYEGNCECNSCPLLETVFEILGFECDEECVEDDGDDFVFPSLEELETEGDAPCANECKHFNDEEYWANMNLTEVEAEEDRLCDDVKEEINCKCKEKCNGDDDEIDWSKVNLTDIQNEEDSICEFEEESKEGCEGSDESQSDEDESHESKSSEEDKIGGKRKPWKKGFWVTKNGRRYWHSYKHHKDLGNCTHAPHDPLHPQNERPHKPGAPVTNEPDPIEPEIPHKNVDTFPDKPGTNDSLAPDKPEPKVPTKPHTPVGVTKPHKPDAQNNPNHENAWPENHGHYKETKWPNTSPRPGRPGVNPPSKDNHPEKPSGGKTNWPDTDGPLNPPEHLGHQWPNKDEPVLNHDKPVDPSNDDPPGSKPPHMPDGIEDPHVSGSGDDFEEPDIPGSGQGTWNPEMSGSGGGIKEPEISGSGDEILEPDISGSGDPDIPGSGDGIKEPEIPGSGHGNWEPQISGSGGGISKPDIPGSGHGNWEPQISGSGGGISKPDIPGSGNGIWQPGNPSDHIGPHKDNPVVTTKKPSNITRPAKPSTNPGLKPSQQPDIASFWEPKIHGSGHDLGEHKTNGGQTSPHTFGSGSETGTSSGSNGTVQFIGTSTGTPPTVIMGTGNHTGSHDGPDSSEEDGHNISEEHGDHTKPKTVPSIVVGSAGPNIGGSIGSHRRRNGSEGDHHNSSERRGQKKRGNSSEEESEGRVNSPGEYDRKPKG